MADLIGQRLSNYEITGVLGKGGMAIVYRARQLNIEREVAIKVIRPDRVETEDMLRRFEREANLVASLTHPNILKLFDSGQHEGMLYLVMEMMLGGTLTDVLKKSRLSTERVAQLLEQIADALDYAHSRGLIHRDLKPQNILLDSQGNAHLTDFGIAKILTESTVLTQSGVAMGTPAYMPPEQWQGLTLSPQADLYSLGVMVFEMLTGRLPFVGGNAANMMYLHLQEPPPPVRSIRPDLPETLDEFFQQAMAKPPEDRFNSAAELRTAFNAAVQGKKLKSATKPVHKPTTRPAIQATDEETETVTDAAAAVEPAAPTRVRRGLLIAGVVAVLLIGGVLLVPAALSSNVAAVPTNTKTGTNTPASTPTQRPSTATPSTTRTHTPLPTLDLIAIAKATNTAEAIAGATSTAAFNLGLTATATLWTPTSTPSSTPTPDGLTPVTKNADWKPQFKDFDGVTMALVPAGCFIMGSLQEGGKQCFDKPFWIDKTEVTQAQFKQFKGVSENISYFKGDERPVESLSWFEARNFCAKRGTRLPTEAEWEYAARGPDELQYPWGNSFIPSLVVSVVPQGFNQVVAGQTANVGSRPNASWVGAVDMIGNAWEWVSSINKAYPYDKNDGRESTTNTSSIRVLRGSVYNAGNEGQAAYRSGGYPSSQLVPFGMRCARDYDEQIEQTANSTAESTDAPIASTQESSAPVAKNSDWIAQAKDFDGVTMVLVPAGCFVMGQTGDGGKQCFDVPFWIDKTEVTQAQFKQFKGFAENLSYFTGDQHPIDTISWFEARNFCAKRGARLPTEAEWEYAARGPDGLEYTWGDDANFRDSRIVFVIPSQPVQGHTVDVDTMPNASWVGAVDMVGNAWEWTSSLGKPYPYNKDDGRESKTDISTFRVIRGAVQGPMSGGSQGTAPYRSVGYPGTQSVSVGFRCARDN